MRKFATKIFETVKGKQVFEKLLVDGICLIDEFENEIRQKKKVYFRIDDNFLIHGFIGKWQLFA